MYLWIFKAGSSNTIISAITLIAAKEKYLQLLRLPKEHLRFRPNLAYLPGAYTYGENMLGKDGPWKDVTTYTMDVLDAFIYKKYINVSKLQINDAVILTDYLDG